MSQAERDQVEQAAETWAKQIGLPYFDTRPEIDITPLVGKLTVEGMSAYGLVPLELLGTALSLGINERTNRDQLEALRARLRGYQVTFYVVSQVGWDRLYHRFQAAVNLPAVNGDYENFTERVNNAEPKQQFEVIAQLAYQLGASDIHLEPGSDTARVRFRIDGTLHPIINLPKDRYDLLTSDLQTRAEAKWNADIPQAGRIKVMLIDKLGDVVPVNMRLETIPSLHGQDVVIRIFSFDVSFLTLDALALQPSQRERLDHVIRQPRGLVLTVGPTGSGKTSSLYAIINELNAEDVKIVTLEDPIEYELAGVSQLPVVSEDSEAFMLKLRAVLREDPNIIMIGEIRDADTARTALQAALTGHLVLASFHAATAAGAIARLMDMIGDNPLLGSSLRLLMAQRLVRRLCPHCKEAYTPEKDELMQIKTVLHDLPAELHPKYEELKLFRPKGCKQCHHYGYWGRLGLFEQIEMNDDLEAVIAHGTASTTARAIETIAVKHGMMTLIQDGVLKVVSGETSLDEVYAAVGD